MKTKNNRIKHLVLALSVMLTLFSFATPALAADPATDAVKNLSTFLFSIVRLVGIMMLLFGVVQLGLSLKGHDPSQRAAGLLTVVGGLLVTFSKEIIELVAGTI